MTLVDRTRLSDAELEAVHRLWTAEYPEKLTFDTAADLAEYLDVLPELCYVLLLDSPGRMEGWALTFALDGETWFAVTVDRALQGRGNGTALLHALKARHDLLSGWVIDHGNDAKRNGEPYASPLAFYRKNGFTVSSDVRLEIPTLSAVKIGWRRVEGS